MKRIASILFLALLVFSMAGGVLAKDEGPSISLDYGFCGYGKITTVWNSLDKTYLTYDHIKFEYPVDNLIINIEYGNLNNPTYYTSNGLVDVTSWDGSLGIGYKVLNLDRCFIYADLLYVYDYLKTQANGIQTNCTTTAFTVGPELRYALSDRLSIQVFAGFSPVVSQSVSAGGEIGTLNNLLNLYRFKINFAITPNIIINAGYYYKYIESHIDMINNDNIINGFAKFSQSVTTLGMTYKF